MQLNN